MRFMLESLTEIYKETQSINNAIQAIEEDVADIRSQLTRAALRKIEEDINGLRVHLRRIENDLSVSIRHAEERLGKEDRK